MTMTAPTLRIEEVTYHRNGVFGEGFYVVAFTCPAAGPMVATVFPRRGHVAVLHRGLLNKGTIAFGENSWRGDEYEVELRAAAKAWERDRAVALRAGPPAAVGV